MLCCGGCFNNTFLREHISVKSTRIGNCNFCPSQDADLIAPADLYDLFSPVIDLYQRVDGEEAGCLVQLLRDDWNLFSGVEDGKAKSILKYLFENQEFDFDGFESQAPRGREVEVKWEEFKKELKHSNRYFPKSFPEHKNLSSLLSYLSVQTGRELSVLYRARKNVDGNRYSIESMWEPPAHIVTAGRANPFGIAYLYAASTEKTALSEVRPHKGESFTVADFHLAGSLKLIDLRNPRDTVSPFRYSDEELQNIYVGLELLVKLGDELTKPVSQDKATLEYLSSQYLCEFIKSQGYEGVIYRSSLGDGDNYALFDWARLKGVKTRTFNISDVDVVANAIGEETVVEQVGPELSITAEGQVKWFNNTIGYGFITNAADKSDLFVHYTSIICDDPRRSLKAGCSVKFSIGSNEKGPIAFDVVPLD